MVAKKILLIIVFYGLTVLSAFSQTTSPDSLFQKFVYVDAGYLLNDMQQPIHLLILKTEPPLASASDELQLMNAIKKKLSEYSQEILVAEWSDSAGSYIIHLVYDPEMKQIR